MTGAVVDRCGGNDRVIAMRPIRPLLLIVGLILVLDAGCNSSEKNRGRSESLDGGYTLREECNVPSMNCYNGCFKREASDTCTGCCYDQRFLCDTGQKYSFESCKDVP